ncbi:putative ammecr1 family protein [Erysiphe necator]|uniref:Putative ammecr1 family protein n=1 Tax=Uncinula necator TaxID=52586 RepID=A0A0B1NW78_UNCNE|nr:putative ammecr1 family protein [Erysiphe necator]
MATPQHCVHCFETLAATFEKREPLSLQEIEESWIEYLHAPNTESSKSKFLSARAAIPSLQASVPNAPIFVTWDIISPLDSNKLSLRGCIGTFESSPLDESLSNYALTSALHDPRFPPIALHELPNLSVSVTLLHDFETCNDPMDWVLGRHGIRVHVRAKKKSWNSCYLPDVAVEQGWDQEQCVFNCMQKSGWDGTKLTWRTVDEIKVIRFQGSKMSMNFREWKDWRDWMDKQPTGKENSKRRKNSKD